MVLSQCAPRDNIIAFRHNLTFISNETKTLLGKRCTQGVQQISESFHIMINTDSRQQRFRYGTIKADILVIKDAWATCYNNASVYEDFRRSPGLVYNQYNSIPHKFIIDLMYFLLDPCPQHKWYDLAREAAVVEIYASDTYPEHCFASHNFVDDFLVAAHNAHPDSLLANSKCRNSFNVIHFFMVRRYDPLPSMALSITISNYVGTLFQQTTHVDMCNVVHTQKRPIIGRLEDYMAQLWIGTYATYSDMQYERFTSLEYIHGNKTQRAKAGKRELALSFLLWVHLRTANTRRPLFHTVRLNQFVVLYQQCLLILADTIGNKYFKALIISIMLMTPPITCAAISARRHQSCCAKG